MFPIAKNDDDSFAKRRENLATMSFDCVPFATLCTRSQDGIVFYWSSLLHKLLAGTVPSIPRGPFQCVELRRLLLRPWSSMNSIRCEKLVPLSYSLKWYIMQLVFWSRMQRNCDQTTADNPRNISAQLLWLSNPVEYSSWNWKTIVNYIIKQLVFFIEL